MRPRAVYNAIWAVIGLGLGMVSTIGAIYRVREAGLDPFELVLVGTTLEITVLLFEIPTGVVADVISRRLSVVIGAFVVGAGFLLEGAVAALWSVLLAQVIWGFGYTFISGANTAWLADELSHGGHRDDHDDHGLAPALLRGTQWYQGALLVGVVLGGVLGIAGLRVPFVVAGLLFVALGVVLALRMEEHGFSPAPREERASWRTFLATFRDGAAVVRHRPVLLLLLGAAAFGGASSETVDRLWQVQFLEEFDIDDVVWFGVLNGGWAVLGIAGSEVVRRRQTSAGALLVGLEVVRLVGLGLFGLAGRIDLAVAGFLSTQVSRQVGHPVFVAWLNTRIRSAVRATVNSIHGQVDALGQLVGGPLLGLFARRASVGAALVASAVVLVPAVGLLAAAATAARTDEVDEPEGVA